MRLRVALALAGIAAPFALPAQASAAPSGTVSMSGSTTALPVVADLAYFYRRSHPGAARFALVGGGSGVGVTDTARGVMSAGFVSRERAASDPPGLVFTRFALSGICLVTNRANRIPGFSRGLVQDLVAGRVTTWAQVPGATQTGAIAGVGLIQGTGARSVFLGTLVDPATPVAYQPRTFSTARQQRDFVLATPTAWAYVDLNYAAGLHVVPFDGIPCTRATVLSGAYPATRPLSFVTRGAPKGAVARFVRWVRSSRVARRVIETRYVPAR